MAVAFGNASGGKTSGGATSLTFAHDATGDDILLVALGQRDSAGTSMTATYDSSSMTADATLSDANQYLATFYIASPSTGSSNIVISWTGSITSLATAVSLNGSAGTIGTTVTAQGAGTDADFDATGTVPTDGLLVAWGETLTGGNGGGLAVSPGTERNAQWQTDSLDMSCATHTASPITYTKTGSDVWNSIGTPVNVAVAAGPAKLKTWNTVLAAKVKTGDTALIAKIKTINTVV